MLNTMDLLNLKAATRTTTRTRTRTERSSRTSGTARTSTMHVTTSYGYKSGVAAWQRYLPLFTLLVLAAHINITSGQIDWDDDDDPGE